MFAALLALSLTAHADPPKNPSEATLNEIKKLEGKWKLEVSVRGGEEIALGDLGIEAVVTFKGRKVILRENNKETEIFTIPMLDTTTNPKLFDFKMLVDRGPLAKGAVVEAIYKLDEETLTLAYYIGDGKKRPVEFESPKDSAIVILKLKRIKE